jgi:hypothetical protein
MRYAALELDTGEAPKEGGREARPGGPTRRGNWPRGAEPEERGGSGPLSWALNKKAGGISLCITRQAPEPEHQIPNTQCQPDIRTYWI